MQRIGICLVSAGGIGVSYTLVTEWVFCATILQVDLQDVARPICNVYLLLEGISSGRYPVNAGNNQMEPLVLSLIHI